MKALVIAGTASGVGKTVATLALIRGFKQAGKALQPAKAGPDFIGSGRHTVVAGRHSRTLDTWLEGVAWTRRNYHQGEEDICVIEGVMGLYDGNHASTAEVTDALDLPVVLVVDSSAGMESVAATEVGFRRYTSQVGRDIDVIGIIAQRARDGRLANGIRKAIPHDLAYFGRLTPRDSFVIPSRHLGLHSGDGAPLDTEGLYRVVAHLDIQGLLELARVPPRPASIAHPD